MINAITNLIQTNPAILMVITIIIGLLVGSFLNVVIYRLPIILKEEFKRECEYFLGHNQEIPQPTFNLAIPKSQCTNCKKPITWWQNIPVISYLLIKGKCHNCSAKISWRYPIVEILTAVSALMIIIYFGSSFKSLALLILTWSIIPIIFIDLDHQLSPDQLTLPLIWLGLLINTHNLFVPTSSAIIGAISGYLSLFIIAKAFKIIRKADGMGNGDFKLLAVFGTWFGWQILPTLVLLASLTGAIIGIALVILKKTKFNQPLPFGPYLAVAGWLTIFYNPSFW